MVHVILANIIKSAFLFYFFFFSTGCKTSYNGGYEQNMPEQAQKYKSVLTVLFYQLVLQCWAI